MTVGVQRSGFARPASSAAASSSMKAREAGAMRTMSRGTVIPSGKDARSARSWARAASRSFDSEGIVLKKVEPPNALRFCCGAC